MNEVRQGLMGAMNAAPQGQGNARLNMLKAMEAKDNEFYQGTFRNMAMQAKDAYSRGDMQTFGDAVRELSRVSPMPYKYEMGQDGNFVETFRSNKHGGYTPTGRKITPNEAMQYLNGILGSEQKMLAGVDMQEKIVNPAFLAQAAHNRLGTVIGNAEALIDESQWIPFSDKAGNTVYAIPQNKHDDYEAGVTYMVFDEANGRSGHVNSLDELTQAGFSPVKQ